MHIVPIDRLHEVLRAQRITMFRRSHFVHTEGVTGSIPVTPTISNHYNPCIFDRFRDRFAKWSTGLAKPLPQNKRADLVLVTPPRP